MENIIIKIFNKLKVEVNSTRKITNGKQNDAYIVNNRYVLRVPKKGQKVDYKREQRILKLLSFMPVPKVILVDTSKRSVPFEYMVETLIPGELWLYTPQLEKNKRLYFLAGKLLRRLNNHKFDFVTDFDLKRNKSWSKLFNRMLRSEIKNIPARLRLKLSISEKDLSKKAYCLDDFNEGNIMIKDSKITGMIDLEQARITPIAFSIVMVMDRMFGFNIKSNEPYSFRLQTLAEAFLKGYGQVPKIDLSLRNKYLYYHYAFMFNRTKGRSRELYKKKLIGVGK